nr:unnamed protein product [Callosobruchus chinensis]
MPYRCCVPNCSGNYGYGDAPKVTVFSSQKMKIFERNGCKLFHAQTLYHQIPARYASYIFRSMRSSVM